MPPPDDESVPRYTDADKTHWEVEKLKAEAQNVRRPFLRTPANAISLATGAIAVVGSVFQYLRTDFEAQQVAITKERNKLEIERLEAKRDTVQREHDAFASQRDQLRAELAAIQAAAESTSLARRALEEAAKSTEQRLAALKSRLTSAQNPPTPQQIQQTFGPFESSLANVKQSSERSAQTAQASSKRLEEIGYELQRPVAVISRVFIHIGREEQRPLAERLQRELAAKNLHVVGIEVVESAPASSEVRYFHRVEDRRLVGTVAHILDSVLPGDRKVQARFLAAKTRVGTIEVWLGMDAK